MTRNRRHRHVCSLLALVSICLLNILGRPVRAQSQPSVESGVVPNRSYDLDKIDSVDTLNG